MTITAPMVEDSGRRLLCFRRHPSPATARQRSAASSAWHGSPASSVRPPTAVRDDGYWLDATRLCFDDDNEIPATSLDPVSSPDFSGCFLRRAVAAVSSLSSFSVSGDVRRNESSRGLHLRHTPDGDGKRRTPAVQSHGRHGGTLPSVRQKRSSNRINPVIITNTSRRYSAALFERGRSRCSAVSRRSGRNTGTTSRHVHRCNLACREERRELRSLLPLVASFDHADVVKDRGREHGPVTEESAPASSYRESSPRATAAAALAPPPEPIIVVFVAERRRGREEMMRASRCRKTREVTEVATVATLLDGAKNSEDNHRKPVAPVSHLAAIVACCFNEEDVAVDEPETTIAAAFAHHLLAAEVAATLPRKREDERERVNVEAAGLHRQNLPLLFTLKEVACKRSPSLLVVRRRRREAEMDRGERDFGKTTTEREISKRERTYIYGSIIRGTKHRHEPPSVYPRLPTGLVAPQQQLRHVDGNNNSREPRQHRRAPAMVDVLLRHSPCSNLMSGCDGGGTLAWFPPSDGAAPLFGGGDSRHRRSGRNTGTTSCHVHRCNLACREERRELRSLLPLVASFDHADVVKDRGREHGPVTEESAPASSCRESSPRATAAAALAPPPEPIVVVFVAERRRGREEMMRASRCRKTREVTEVATVATLLDGRKNSEEDRRRPVAPVSHLAAIVACCFNEEVVAVDEPETTIATAFAHHLLAAEVVATLPRKREDERERVNVEAAGLHRQNLPLLFTLKEVACKRSPSLLVVRQRRREAETDRGERDFGKTTAEREISKRERTYIYGSIIRGFYFGLG
nr:hypothetical protein Iba_chr12aCG10510 [Ipomoea batatas]